LDNEIDRKIDVTAIQFLLVQNWQQTHDWTLIGSGVNGLGIHGSGLGLLFPLAPDIISVQPCVTGVYSEPIEMS